MKFVSRLLTVTILLTGTSAVAASSTPWNGIYGGLNAGYSWENNSNDISTTSGNIIAGSDFSSSVREKPEGFTGGGQVGYDKSVMQGWVLGVVTDLDYTNMNNSNSLPGPADPTRIMNSKQTLDEIGTLRARVGYTPVNNALGYVTGGLAYGNGRVETNLSRTSGCAGNNCEAGSASDLMAGWTIGGGVEYALTSNATIGAEYLYYNLGSISEQMTDPNFPGNVFESKTGFNGNIVRVTMNWHF